MLMEMATEPQIQDHRAALPPAQLATVQRACRHIAALGRTAATYAKGGRGAEIAYATTATPLGRLLVAATHRGVCFVSLGASDAPLEKALAAEFPAATLRRDEAALGTELALLVAYLEGAEPPTALPLDIRCT